MYIPCTYHVHTCIYICRNVYTCMYMFMFFKYCTYHVWQLLYYSMVCIRYIHGTDMSVHVYARWSGFQMTRIVLPSGSAAAALASLRLRHRAKQHRGYIGRGKSLYYAFRLISCQPRLGTRPGGLGKLHTQKIGSA